MPGRASMLCVALVVTAGSAVAQPVTASSQFQLGKAAMDRHDPTAAIAHFEQADGKEAAAWLAVALMMESRSPSDRYVERAFDAAVRARTDHPALVRPRADLAAALRPGDIVITFLVGETHAYAWALDRDTVIGYPLPPTAEIATAVARVNAYAAQQDRAGVQRVAEDLLPVLLGPVLDRIPSLTRMIFVMDGALRQLPIGALPIDQAASTLAQRVVVATVDDASVFDEIRQPPPQPRRTPWTTIVLLAGAIAVAVVSLRARRRSHARS